MTHTMPAGSDIREGFRTTHRYSISAEVYEDFLAAYRDTNPMHTDDAFARRHGFPDRVMHGTILNGFISHFVGVYFPGGAVLLHSVNTQYKTPCHLGDEIDIEATVTQVAESVRVLTMEMVLRNVTRDRIAAKAKVQVGLL
ncbi:MAG: MaoC family dehydratase N-terminal domain-containing protein [Deltaproteobacteria bacterium]|nr:MaoC family dehydratase N-terminal domain-containing protein [Deltaproteobacteria bacterium]